MLLVVVLILSAKFIVPGASQDLTVILADAAAGAVWSVGIDPASGITGKCLYDNPILDVCYRAGTIYIAGGTSTLPGANSTFGGHIARIGSDCKPELIAQFPQACTAIGCDDHRLVFALEGVGIKSIRYDGSDEQDHGLIADCFIRNIDVHIPTHTCYFVDMTSSSVYSADYTVNIVIILEPLGLTSAFAVGVLLDVECQNHDPVTDWNYLNTNELSFNISGPNNRTFQPIGSRGKVIMGKSTDGEEQLEFYFDQPTEVYVLSLEYTDTTEIHLTLYDTMGGKWEDCFQKLPNETNKWTPVSFTPPLKGYNKGVISFGDFEPSNEVKIRDATFGVCPEGAFATAVQPFLNIVHSDCRVERCNITGPFIGCPVISPSTFYETCLPVCGTRDRVMLHNDMNSIYEIFPYEDPPLVTSTSSSAFDVVGMDCFVRNYATDDELCDPNPCQNDGVCVQAIFGYSCYCPSPFMGKNCEELPCPECVPS